MCEYNYYKRRGHFCFPHINNNNNEKNDNNSQSVLVIRVGYKILIILAEIKLLIKMAIKKYNSIVSF